MHARQIALECMTAVNFQTLSSVILWKRDASAVQRLGGAYCFFGTQLETFALDTNRRPYDAPAVANGTGTGNLVVNVLAARIHILREGRLNKGNEGDTGDRASGR